MSLLVQAIIGIVVGVAEKCLPSFLAYWRERDERAAVAAQKVADDKAIDAKIAAIKAELAAKKAAASRPPFINTPTTP